MRFALPGEVTLVARRIHLDVNAGAPLREEARAAMLAAFGVNGNPSSIHAEGRAARRLVEESRERIATLLRSRPVDVVFTGGATEALNAVLTPNAPRHQNPAPLSRLLVGATEHVCVLQGHRFPADRVETIAVDCCGRVDNAALEARVKELTAVHGEASVVVALQAANNETGVLQDLSDLERRLRPTGAMIVCDAAQLAGKMPFDPVGFGADALVVSAHKLGGPKGIGAIAYGGDYFHPEPLLRGGGQEQGRRAGTENVAAIAGFAAAAEAAFAEAEAFARRTAALRDRFEAFIRSSHADALIFGAGAPRLPNTTCVAVPGVAAETLLIGLDLAGVAVSSGSACSSGKVAPSHVLSAMGVDAAVAKCAVRVSFGWDSAAEDLDMFQAVWSQVAGRALKGHNRAA
jgi:cysteine desulfurase